MGRPLLNYVLSLSENPKGEGNEEDIFESISKLIVAPYISLSSGEGLG
jgi:hypothetical protein